MLALVLLLQGKHFRRVYEEKAMLCLFVALKIYLTQIDLPLMLFSNHAMYTFVSAAEHYLVLFHLFMIKT